MKSQKDWFATWFNSRYYHILYKHRNDSEAQLFMQNLIKKIKITNTQLLLDLACGKGRHSIFLNSLGYNVEGADLSVNSINHAKQFENERLHFFEHDMRDSFLKKYDVILNLFTSFGFFENDDEDIIVLNNIKNGLERNGIAVIDFMNSKVVEKELVNTEKIEVDNIVFNISRYIKDGFIIKEISFEADNRKHTYYEKVKLLSLEKIKKYIKKVGFSIKYVFGDYELNTFEEDKSNRLILVLE